MIRKSFINGTIILMLAGFIVKIFGFMYRVYLSSLMGAEGMGVFQLIVPLYTLIILTLTSGTSIAVSKMASEQYARCHAENVRRITLCGLGFVIVLSMIVSLTLCFFVNFIVNIVIKDIRAYSAIIVLIPSIPIIVASSALKGYFYAISEVVPTAFSQMAEQLVRIGVIVLVSKYVSSMSIEAMCALATIGMTLGEAANLLILIIFYRFKSRRINIFENKKSIMRKRNIIKEIIKISTPVSFNRLITSIMAMVEVILIPRMLLVSGMDYQQSMQEFGKMIGMAMPLIFFPSLVTSSLCVILVPAISEALSLRNYEKANQRISKSIQVTFILGFIFTVIFFNFHNDISNIVYKRENIGDMLHVLAYTCVVTYLAQTLVGIQNGLGKQGISLRNSIIACLIRIAFVCFCIPLYGIRGYVCGIVMSLVVFCVLSLNTIIESTNMKLDMKNWVIKPFGICIFMVYVGKYITEFFYIFGTEYIITVILSILMNVIVGLIMMFLVGAIKREEIFELIGCKKGLKI